MTAQLANGMTHKCAFIAQRTLALTQNLNDSLAIITPMQVSIPVTAQPAVGTYHTRKVWRATELLASAPTPLLPQR